MIINLGDTIVDERGREGVVTNIGIATEPEQPKGLVVMTHWLFLHICFVN